MNKKLVTKLLFGKKNFKYHINKYTWLIVFSFYNKNEVATCNSYMHILLNTSFRKLK